MKKMLLIYLCFTLLTVQKADAFSFFHIFNHKKVHEFKFVMETFGPATVKCYYRVTQGADFTLDRFEEALKTGYISKCLQQTAAEQAEFLQKFSGGVHK
jgi:hypothetical protein